MLKITYYDGSNSLYDERRRFQFPEHYREAQIWTDQISAINSGIDIPFSSTFDPKELCSDSGLTIDTIEQLIELASIYPTLAEHFSVTPDFLRVDIGSGYSIKNLFPAGQLKIVSAGKLDSVYSCIHSYAEAPELERLFQFQLACDMCIEPDTVIALRRMLSMRENVASALSSRTLWYEDGLPNIDKMIRKLGSKLSADFWGLRSSSMKFAIEFFDFQPAASKLTNNGQVFENQLEGLLNALGFRCERTPVSGDFGVDLILHAGDHRIALQAKDYQAAVGVSAVMEVAAGAKHYGCNAAVVMGRGEFTPAARELAKSTGTKLVSEGELLHSLKVQALSVFTN